MPAADRWKQLGEQLQDRRVDLDPRYRNFQLFIDERQVNYRLAWDLENAKRTNYRLVTLRGVDAAYGLVAGSIKRFVDDGTPLQPIPSGAYADPTLQQVFDAAEGLPEDARRGVVELVRQIRAADERKAAAAGHEGNGALSSL